MIKMEKYKQGNSKSIIVNLNDVDLLNVSKDFLKDIEINFKNFNDEYSKNFEKMGKYIVKNENFKFTPEKLAKKSPLTIINAPWGTGKTYFIENFVKLFIDEKISSEIFQKIIVIDAWKFSNSKDVPIEFSEEISKIIVEMQSKVEDQKTKDRLILRLFKKWYLSR